MILCSKELGFVTTAKHVYLRKTMNYWNSAYSLFAGANWNILKDFPLKRIMELCLGKYESSIISFCKAKTKLTNANLKKALPYIEKVVWDNIYWINAERVFDFLANISS